MPTGYTAGVVDGTTKSFNEFARRCARAFGATIHMRDDGFDAPYMKRAPSSYHLDAINDAEEKLRNAIETSDEDIIETEHKRINESIKYHKEGIKKQDKAKKTLEEFLADAVNYIPPTEEHTGVKKFMIDQLTMTIESDCTSDYHARSLDELTKSLSNIDAKVIRLEMIDDANRDIKYHVDHYNEDVSLCEVANKWVEDYYNSLETDI